ncbi:MAG: hypothetical protein ACFE0J_20685 [Elainellaceae cyanobacterium]
MAPKFLKHLPTPVRWLIRPMLLLSLLLHGVFLLVPVPANQQSDDRLESSEETSIKITQLPDRTQAPPTPDSSEPPTPDSSEPPAPKPRASSSVPSRSPSSSPIPPASPRPTTPADSSEPSTRPDLAAPETPETPETPEPPVADSTPLPFANFPHLANARAGCFGLGNCRQVEGGSFRQVGTNLVDQLKDQGYDVDPRDDLEETGIKVYEVTHDGDTQYLTVLSPWSGETGGAFYVLAPEPITPNDLENADPLATEFQQILSQAANGRSASYTDFSDLHFFFDGGQLRAEVSEPAYIVADTPPDRLSIANQLESAGFSVDAVGRYAGAPIYKVQRDAFVAYLSILPTQNGTGSILVAWNRPPQLAT